MTNVQKAITEAKELLAAIKESKISHFDRERAVNFLSRFEGGVKYCVEMVENAESWEKKEFQQVLDGNFLSLQEVKEWFQTMKEHGLA